MSECVRACVRALCGCVLCVGTGLVREVSERMRVRECECKWACVCVPNSYSP